MQTTLVQILERASYRKRTSYFFLVLGAIYVTQAMLGIVAGIVAAFYLTGVFQ